MDARLFARIGAVLFVAVALTVTALELREERPAPRPEPAAMFEFDGDPLPARLRACAAMGELALSHTDCRKAWAEKRRRFLSEGKRSGAAAAPVGEPAAAGGE